MFGLSILCAVYLWCFFWGGALNKMGQVRRDRNGAVVHQNCAKLVICGAHQFDVVVEAQKAPVISVKQKKTATDGGLRSGNGGL